MPIAGKTTVQLYYMKVHDRSICAQIHVPYSYGWSIIALTALVKLATYPLTKTQVSTYTSVSKRAEHASLFSCAAPARRGSM